MLKIVKAVSRFLSTYTSLVVIGCAVIAFFVPVAFGWVHGNVSSVILGIIMLSMGLTLSVEDIKILFKRPFDILLGAVAQYTIMPLIAFTLTKVFGLDPYLAVGIILVGCCPGGVSSNVMSFLARGDVAFSVGMTTASTLLAPIMTPPVSRRPKAAVTTGLVLWAFLANSTRSRVVAKKPRIRPCAAVTRIK